MGIDVERKTLPFDGAKAVVLRQCVQTGVTWPSGAAVQGKCDVFSRGAHRFACERQLLTGRSRKMHSPVEKSACKRARRKPSSQVGDACPHCSIDVLHRAHGGKAVARRELVAPRGKGLTGALTYAFGRHGLRRGRRTSSLSGWVELRQQSIPSRRPRLFQHDRAAPADCIRRKIRKPSPAPALRLRGRPPYRTSDRPRRGDRLRPSRREHSPRLP